MSDKNQKRCPQSSDGVHRPEADRVIGDGRGVDVDEDAGVVRTTIVCSACWESLSVEGPLPEGWKP
jgi:hypothetical protein